MSTTSKASGNIFSPERDVTGPRLCLAWLSIAPAYAVLQNGGRDLTDWNICLLIIGIAALTYWWRRAPPGAVTDNRAWQAALFLFPAYLVLQVVPLPLWLLRVVSPARAAILGSLADLHQSVSFASLSVTPATTFVYLFRVIGYTLTFLVIRDICQRLPERLRWLPVIPLIAVAAAEAAVGLWQNAGGDEVEGTYVNRNHFAGLLEMVLPLVLAYGVALLAKRRAGRASAGRPLGSLAVFGAAGLIFAGLVYSLSKMGFVAGLGGLFAMGVLAVTGRLRGWKRWLLLAGLTALVLFVFIFLPPDELVGRFGGLAADKQNAAEGRWPIWADTLHLIAAYPLAGCGLGNYEVAFLKYQASVVDVLFDYAHNDYLQLTAELGAAGIVLLGMLVLPVVARAFRAATQGRDSNSLYLGMGCAGSLVAIGLHSLTDFNTYIPANALVLAWIAGIAASLTGQPERNPSSVDARHRGYARTFAIVLGWLLLGYAPAWILFEAAFRSDVRAERLFCRMGICDTDAVITAQSLERAGNVARVPAPELLQALRRDPNSPNRWCDAAEALLQGGQTAQADFCADQAIRLGPNLPPVLMRVSDFYFRRHKTALALAPRAHVLAETDGYDGLIFDWYGEKKIPVAAVLAHGLPPDRRAAQAYLRYLMNLARMPEAAAVWDWTGSHRYADDRLAGDYAWALVNQRDYETAAETWARYLGPRADGYLDSTRIFNGDFETDFSKSPFDWKIDERDDVAVSRDAGVAHSGAHSLRIEFQKKGNLSYAQIVQTAFVRPGRYRFEAFMRTQEITTDEGLGFHISDPDASNYLDMATERLTGTHDWTKIERVIEVGPQTQRVEIRVVRQPSQKFDNEINGTVWIDSVRLAPLDKPAARGR